MYRYLQMPACHKFKIINLDIFLHCFRKANCQKYLHYLLLSLITIKLAIIIIHDGCINSYWFSWQSQAFTLFYIYIYIYIFKNISCESLIFVMLWKYQNDGFVFFSLFHLHFHPFIFTKKSRIRIILPSHISNRPLSFKQYRHHFFHIALSHSCFKRLSHGKRFIQTVSSTIFEMNETNFNFAWEKVKPGMTFSLYMK